MFSPDGIMSGVDGVAQGNNVKPLQDPAGII